MLFQVATDAVFVIDPNTLKIADANDTAARLFGLTSEQLVGKSPTIGIEPDFARVVEGLLSAALTAGFAAEARVRLAKGGLGAKVSATPYTTSGPTVLLLRVRMVPEQVANAGAESKLMALVDRTQDAMVITDHHGKIITGNPAFAALFEFDDESAAVGRPLGDWLGTIEDSVPQTISALVQNGVVPLFVTGLRTSKGRALQVELSSTLLPEGNDFCVGFIMRATAVRSMSSQRPHGDGGPAHSLH
jgi:PAS domain S-box-containing protein